MIKVSISYLIIVSLSMNNCQSTNLSEGTRLKLSNAFEENNLLSVEWNTFPGEATFANFTIRLDNLVDEINDECILRHYAETGMDTVQLMSTHQLSKRRVIMKWIHSRAEQAISYGTDLQKILIVDIFQCRYVKNITYPVSIRSIPKDLIVYYDEGFDVVMTGWNCAAAINCRERYNINGKKLGDINYLPLKFNWMTWQSLSKKTRSKGLFMQGTNAEENSPTQVYRVRNHVEHLFNLRSRDRLISYVESEKWYVICGQDIYNAELIVCAQYYLSNDKVFETQTVLSQPLKFIGVRGLTKGGVLLFAIDGNAKLLVSEMTPGIQPKIQNFQLKQNACENSDFVIQMSDSEKTFIIAYETDEPKHQIIIQTLELSKESRK